MHGLLRNNLFALLAGSLLLLAACGERAEQSSAAISARVDRSHPYYEPQPDTEPALPVQTPYDGMPRIAIIIDDLGNNHKHGMESIALPGAVTLSIMPHTPFGQALARVAHEQGREIMLHMPMSNTADKYVVSDTLTPAMSHQAFNAVLTDAIASVPYITGVNNHTGSELTAMDEPMRWLMAVLKQHQLFFIDSRTTANSVAATQAEVAGIPYASRQVFLDHEINREAIDRSFRKLLKHARDHGQAIGIGHPHPETLSYLNEAIGYLPKLGIELVYVSELLHTPGQTLAHDLKDAPIQGTLASRMPHKNEAP